MEINKIIVAIVVTLIIIVGIGKISDLIYQVDQPSKLAYKVEPTEESSIKTDSSETSADLSALFAFLNIHYI